MAKLTVFTSFKESAAGLQSRPSTSGHHTFRGVTIIRAGLGNRRDKHYYPPEVLKEAVSNGLFEGLRAYVDHPTSVDQQIQPERTIRDLAGIYDNARFIETGGGRVVADLHVLPSHKWLADSVHSLVKLGYGDKIGISINGRGATVRDTKRLEEGGEPTEVFRVTKFTALPSADVVTEAGAGGGFQQLLESATGAATQRGADMARTIHADLQQLIDDGKVTPEALSAILSAHPEQTVREADEDEGAEADEDADEDADDEGAEADEDADAVTEGDPGDEDADAVTEGADADGDCGCRGSKRVKEAGMPHGVPKSGGSGKATKPAKGRQPIGRKFGEASHLRAENERLRAQNIRLREALSLTQKRDRIAKLLKESSLPPAMRGPLAKRLLRLSSEAEIRDEIRFQTTLLESAADSVAADLGGFDEVEGAGARFRESAGSGGQANDMLSAIGGHLPLKSAK